MLHESIAKVTSKRAHFVRQQEIRPRAPPTRRSERLLWLRQNLFSSPLSSLATLLSVAVIVAFLPPLVEWAVRDAVWVSTSRDDCVGLG